MEFFNLNKLLNRFLDWKITLILHGSNDLLTALYKRFLKFKKNVPKNGKTTSNLLFGTVSTIFSPSFKMTTSFANIARTHLAQVNLYTRKDFKSPGTGSLYEK